MTNQTMPMSPTEQAPGGGSIQIPLGEKILTAEVNGDYSLPDYQPEIKRLLRITASVLPPARYAASGNIDLSGTVDYFVLYMGNDDRLYCAPLSAEYSLAVPLVGNSDAVQAASEPLVCTCDITPESTTGRVTAPRKLNIRCRLKARAGVLGEVSLRSDEESGLVPGSVERLSEQAEVGRLVQGLGDVLSLQDDMILPPAEGEVRVICAEGQVMVTEADVGNDMVNCRGEVTLKLTLCSAEATPSPDPNSDGQGADGLAALALPQVVYRKVPFSQTVELAGIVPGSECCAFGVCSELSVQVEEGHLHTDLGVVLEVLAQCNQTVSYTRDLYSTRSESTCRYVTYTPGKAIRCLNGNFTMSDSLALSDAGLDPSVRIADITAFATPEDVICDKGRYILTGTCKCQLLLSRGGEYSSTELSFPFRYETDTTTRAASADGIVQADSPVFDGHVTVVNCRARMDGERVGVDAELAVCLRLAEKQPLTALSGMDFGPDLTRRRGEYVICFPAPADTLWSVGKRYHAPLAALAAANSLPAGSSPDLPETLHDVKYLIV